MTQPLGHLQKRRERKPVEGESLFAVRENGAKGEKQKFGVGIENLGRYIWVPILEAVVPAAFDSVSSSQASFLAPGTNKSPFLA